MTITYQSSYESACRNKRTYLNSKAAKKAAAQAQSVFGGRAMCHYRCVWCSRWHTGHASEWGLEQARMSA